LARRKQRCHAPIGATNSVEADSVWIIPVRRLGLSPLKISARTGLTAIVDPHNQEYPIMTADLRNWTPRPRPERIVIEGRYVRLEPLDPASHGEELFQASHASHSQERFRYLFEQAASDRAVFDAWLEKSAASEDPLFFAVVDQATGKVVGRQALMRIDPNNGVAEIGNIYWGPNLSRTPGATEAMMLFAKTVFDLGYRRYEWKCNNNNEPSKRAAERFGFTFEGVFRQHMIQKGENRDTAWFSMLDSEWPALKAAYDAWLDPSNFDEAGSQKRRLQDMVKRPA
jgi:RimJ/RimL family protein N-acetyltransferase